MVVNKLKKLAKALTFLAKSTILWLILMKGRGSANRKTVGISIYGLLRLGGYYNDQAV